MNELRCPSCGHALALALAPVAVTAVRAAPAPRAAEAAAPPPAPKPRVCGCGHSTDRHTDGTGPCQHGKGTMFDGCDCQGVHSRRRGARKSVSAEGDLSPQAAKIAFMVALHHPEPAPVVQVAIALGYSHGSGTFAKALTRLRAEGIITGSGALNITPAGRQRYGGTSGFDASGVLSEWAERLGAMAGSILLRIVAAHPQAATPEALARETGYRATSGSFAKALRKLRRLGLVDGWTASASLMRALESIPSTGPRSGGKVSALSPIAIHEGHR